MKSHPLLVLAVLLACMPGTCPAQAAPDSKPGTSDWSLPSGEPAPGDWGNWKDKWKWLRDKFRPAPKPPLAPPAPVPPPPPVAPPVPAPKAPEVHILSWNLQTFGKHAKSERVEAYRTLFDRLTAADGSIQVLAVQEIAHEAGAVKFESLLPGGAADWTLSFQDAKDSMENGFYVKKGVQVDCEGAIPGTRHPARMAHMKVGDLDFTIITLHLSFEGGDAAASSGELNAVLGWLKDYYDRPGHDPDVIIVGDFNLPTRQGKTASRRGHEGSWSPIEDVIDQYPLFKPDLDGAGRRKPKTTDLVALVDDVTSRPNGNPANNYDHFILSGDLFDQEYIQGSAGPTARTAIEAMEQEKGVLVSDHLPITASFRTGGTGADGRPIHLDGNGSCPR